MQSENHTRASYAVTAYRIYSPSETYLYIEQSKTDDLKCGATQHFEVFYNVNELSEQSTFYYMVVTSLNASFNTFCKKSYTSFR